MLPPNPIADRVYRRELAVFVRRSRDGTMLPTVLWLCMFSNEFTLMTRAPLNPQLGAREERLRAETEEIIVVLSDTFSHWGQVGGARRVRVGLSSMLMHYPPR